MFVIYTPPFHSVFGGSHKLLPLYWLIPIAFGFLILLWASIRVLLARRSIERTRVKDIHGLKMCKCPFKAVPESFIILTLFLKSLRCVPTVCARGIERFYEQGGSARLGRKAGNGNTRYDALRPFTFDSVWKFK